MARRMTICSLPKVNWRVCLISLDRTLGFYRDTGSPTEVYLHQLMENVISVYSSKLLSAGVTIDKQFRDRRKMLVRKGEILQIFSNIITNAADAMRQGGVLSISTRETVSSTGNGIQTVVRDTGVGIRQEHLAQIFEPFFTTKGDLGTGIGLWVTRQLVEGRGGQISVVSSTENGNSGTTVTISSHLPRPLTNNRHRKDCDTASECRFTSHHEPDSALGSSWRSNFSKEPFA